MAGSADHGTTIVFDEDKAVAAADEILARRRSRAAASAVKPKARMSESELSLIMSMKRCDMASDEDEDMLELLRSHNPDRYTPGELEKRRREHRELVAMFREGDDEIEARQADVMRELAEKGYVEAGDEVFVDEFNEWTRVVWEGLGIASTCKRLRVIAEENDEALRNFLSRKGAEEEDGYYSDEEEDYYGDEDSDDDAGTVEPSDN